jgi:hypothetical protein
VRDAWRPPELAEVWRTIRFALRSLLRTPAFTALAVVTLALGVGVNTVMFSFFQALVLKPIAPPRTSARGASPPPTSASWRARRTASARSPPTRSTR